MGFIKAYIKGMIYFSIICGILSLFILLARNYHDYKPTPVVDWDKELIA